MLSSGVYPQRRSLSFYFKAGRGELIMSRRLRGHGPFQASSFKPCPSCLSWVTNLARHRSHTDRCVAKATKMTKREALLKSAVQMGRHLGASTELQNEVLAKMSNDNISHVLTNDRLIVALGNAAMKKKHQKRNSQRQLCEL